MLSSIIIFNTNNLNINIRSVKKLRSIILNIVKELIKDNEYFWRKVLVWYDKYEYY